jgi:hypothetical protein
MISRVAGTGYSRWLAGILLLKDDEIDVSPVYSTSSLLGGQREKTAV